MLDQIRTSIPAQSRATVYAVAAALVTALVSWGVLDDAAAPAVVGVATAVVTLAFAVIHSDSPWRQALYSLMAATTVLMAYLGYGDTMQWESILATVAPVLGIGTAAATTGGAEYVGQRRSEWAAVDGEE